MVKPWSDAGYECWLVDKRHSRGITKDGNVVRIGSELADFVETHTGLPFRIVFAFPPCTHLARSGARHFKSKGLHKLADAIRLVAYCKELCESTGAPYCIENPVGTLSTYWRKPDHYFDPADYAGYGFPGEAYTKRTCLWTGNGFVLPEKRPLPAVAGSKMHWGVRDAHMRSVTPHGFAKAVFEANQ